MQHLWVMAIKKQWLMTRSESLDHDDEEDGDDDNDYNDDQH